MNYSSYDDFVPGDTVVCIVGNIVSPGRFSVIPSLESNNVEKLMRKMQPIYSIMDQNQEDLDAIRDYKPLAVLFQHEWHRGIAHEDVMASFNPDRMCFKVKLVDFGEIVCLRRADIRALQEKHARIKAQAISCTVQLGPLYNPLVTHNADGTTTKEFFNQGQGWNPKESTILKERVFDKDILVNFRQRIVLPSGEQVWEVVIHLHEHNQLFSHIERAVIAESRGRYFKSKDEVSQLPVTFEMRPYPVRGDNYTLLKVGFVKVELWWKQQGGGNGNEDGNDEEW